MKANIGTHDRIIRIVIAVAMVVLLLVKFIFGFNVMLVAMSIPLFLIITSVLSYCPIYNIFGINTKKNLNDKAYNNFKKQFNYHH